MSAYRGLDKLDSEFKKKVELFMSEVEKYGVFITETWRSDERQAELVEQGLSKVKRSKHQDGLAIDIAFEGDELYPENMNLWRFVAQKAAKYGIDWGYELWGWDKPHFQDNGERYNPIPDWGADAWNWALENGLVSENSEFTSTLTKGEMIVILKRFNDIQG